MATGFYIFAVESFLLSGVFCWRKFIKKDNDKVLLIITILALINSLAYMSGFINLRGISLNSLVYKAVFMLFALECVLSDFILVLSAQYLLEVVKLKTKLTSIAFVLFWGFCILDSLVFCTNGLTNFAYTGTIIDALESPVVPVYFYHSSGQWTLFHHYFNLTLVLLIFIAMVLKCAGGTLVYTGKYITIGFYFLAVSTSAFASEFLNIKFLNDTTTGFLMSGIPLLLYYQLFYYRPRVLLSSIRRLVFERLGSPVVLFDDEELLADYNHDAETLFNLQKNQINHLTIKQFLKNSVGNQMRKRSASTVEEVTVKKSSGQTAVYKLDYSKLSENGKNYGTLLLFHDISELKQLYNTMERTAMTDLLTGLSSRVHLNKKITEINLYRKFPYTAVVCSLNGIQLIEQGFGEDAANAAIMHVAELLRSSLRASDFAAYDDENMIVLMPDTSVEMAENVFRRISNKLEQDKTFNFSLSFEYGIAARTSPDSSMHLTVSQAQADMISTKMKKHEEVHQSIIDSLRNALKLSSFETEQHSTRVQSLAVQIASKLSLPESEMENLKNLALFHDIGKLSIPAVIMNKPTSLTEEEKKIMQLHVINGSTIASSSEELAPVAMGILCHHERWDGTGYPHGWAGEKIPYLARIVSVADTFDVITHDRPYKVALPVEAAVKEISENKGRQFDPKVVEAFLEIDPKDILL